ncbi:uncharacterized protein LOC128987315 isoform X2 [Macrosteles quadrilineatus]|uniref:uncharacterized protein LOC128987315 isoform X2 n=1 Tax=Macrosteles quadrilineatus TaxID=74068 RepID=UPI0023E28D3C|nr:uncharacterized protein LOC128987315 isoform X2 [Macrosteles quadrilineatus]
MVRKRSNSAPVTPISKTGKTPKIKFKGVVSKTIKTKDKKPSSLEKAKVKKICDGSKKPDLQMEENPIANRKKKNSPLHRETNKPKTKAQKPSKMVKKETTKKPTRPSKSDTSSGNSKRSQSKDKSSAVPKKEKKKLKNIVNNNNNESNKQEPEECAKNIKRGRKRKKSFGESKAAPEELEKTKNEEKGRKRKKSSGESNGTNTAPEEVEETKSEEKATEYTDQSCPDSLAMIEMHGSSDDLPDLIVYGREDGDGSVGVISEARNDQSEDGANTEGAVEDKDGADTERAVEDKDDADSHVESESSSLPDFAALYDEWEQLISDDSDENALTNKDAEDASDSLPLHDEGALTNKDTQDDCDSLPQQDERALTNKDAEDLSDSLPQHNEDAFTSNKKKAEDDRDSIPQQAETKVNSVDHVNRDKTTCASSEDSIKNKILESNKRKTTEIPSEVSKIDFTGLFEDEETLPETASRGPSMIPQRKSSSPKRSILEDDLLLSSSPSSLQSMFSISSLSSSSTKGGSELNKSKKYEVKTVSPCSKVTLKRKTDRPSSVERQYKRKCPERIDSTFPSNSSLELEDQVLNYKNVTQASPSSTTGSESGSCTRECSVTLVRMDDKLAKKQTSTGSLMKQDNSTHSKSEKNYVDLNEEQTKQLPYSISMKDCSIKVQKLEQELQKFDASLSPSKEKKQPTLNLSLSSSPKMPEFIPIKKDPTSNSSSSSPRKSEHITIKKDSTSNSSLSSSKKMSDDIAIKYSPQKMSKNITIKKDGPKSISPGKKPKVLNLYSDSDKKKTTLIKEPCSNESHITESSLFLQPVIQSRNDDNAKNNQSSKRANALLYNFDVKVVNIVEPKLPINPTFKLPPACPEKRKPPVDKPEIFRKPFSRTSKTLIDVTRDFGETAAVSDPDPLCQSNNQEDDNDDNQSCISLAAATHLINFFDREVEEEPENTRFRMKKGNVTQSNPSKNQFYSLRSNEPTCSKIDSTSYPPIITTTREEPSSSVFNTSSFWENKEDDDEEEEDDDDDALAFKRRKTVKEQKKVSILINEAETKSRSYKNSAHESLNPNEIVKLGEPFHGFCLNFLRSSVPKSDNHKCNLKHEVPKFLFRPSKWSTKEISRGILQVSCRNFNNPPLGFLKGIVSFSITQKEQDINLVKQVLIGMKNCMSSDDITNERYLDIWNEFMKSLFGNVVKFVKDPADVINDLLSTAIPNHNQMTDLDQKILTSALDLITSLSSSLKLLSCVEFLNKRRCKLDLYPTSFIEAVIHQVKRFPTKNFVFKVYKTFFDTYEDCINLHNKTEALTEEFLKLAAPLITNYKNVVLDKLDCLINRREDQNHSSYRQKMNNGDLSRRDILTRQPTSNDNKCALDQQSTNMNNVDLRLREISTRQPTSNDQKLALEQQLANTMIVNRTPGLTELLQTSNPRNIFHIIRPMGSLHYLNELQSFGGTIKKKCNNITMSFILLESERGYWDNCYRLYQQMIEFNPDDVQDFVNEENNPLKRLLTIVQCCLESHHLEEAIQMCTKYGLFRERHSQWLQNNKDKEKWKHLCQSILNALDELSEINEHVADLYINIMKQQESLCVPIRILDVLEKFFENAAIELDCTIICNLITKVVMAISQANLVKELQLGIDYYRILVVAMCRSNVPLLEVGPICARIMKRSQTLSRFYPQNWNKDCDKVTVNCCFTVEELQAYILFKLLTFKKTFETKSLYFSIEEPEVKEEFKHPYLQNVECSVRAAIQRFKKACQTIDEGFKPSCLIIKDSLIIMDKVVGNELLKTAPSGNN